MQQLEPQLGVLLLVAGSLGEDACDLLIPVLLGAGGLVRILGLALGFTGKRGHQVFFGLRAFQIHNHKLLPMIVDLF